VKASVRGCGGIALSEARQLLELHERRQPLVDRSLKRFGMVGVKGVEPAMQPELRLLVDDSMDALDCLYW
jgi:hypothetical protein